MTPEEQALFVHQLTSSVAKELVDKILLTGDVPVEWDGHELRRWLAEKFAREVYPMRPGRVRAFNNARLEHRL